MEWKAVSGIMLTLLLISVLRLTFLIQPIKAESSSETKVYVDPPSIVDSTLTLGSSLTVDVMVSDVDDENGCYRWQVYMSWNPDVLKFGSVAEGDFLKDQPEGTVGFSRIEESWVILCWSTMGNCPGVKGSGTLATIEFLVAGIGESIIVIDHSMTRLLGIIEYPRPPPPPAPQVFNTFIEIPCIKENGYFSNLGAVVVSSSIDINPDILNLKSKGRWIAAYLEPPEDYNVSDIDVSTVKLNNVVSAETFPTKIGDYDHDGIPDLMVKFDRQEVIVILSVGEATLAITGKVNGILFEGSDTIRVIDK